MNIQTKQEADLLEMLYAQLKDEKMWPRRDHEPPKREEFEHLIGESSD